MSFALKAAASYGLPVAVVVAAGELLIQAATAAQTTPSATGNPVVDGLLGGGAVGAGVWLYFSKRLDEKADKSQVAEMRDDIRDIRRHLMGDK